MEAVKIYSFGGPPHSVDVSLAEILIKLLPEARRKRFAPRVLIHCWKRAIDYKLQMMRN